MAFLQSAQRAVADPATPAAVRLTLEFLLANAVGRNNAIPLHVILDYLADNGHSMSGPGFQTTILSQCRVGNGLGEIFIGSGPRGYFLIAGPDDARVMLDFYGSRIASETERVAHIHRLMQQENWGI